MTEVFENSFEIIAREWYLLQEKGWSQSHVVRTIRRLEQDIFPSLGGMDINEINAPLLLDVIRKIEARGAIETAHRSLANVGQVFRYAIVTGRAERDVSADLRGALTPFRSKKHFAALTDPSKIGSFLRQTENYEGSFIVKCALRLAPLVFVRPGELRQAKWKDMDFDKK